MHSETRRTLLLGCVVLWTAIQAFADAGVFTGNGQNLHQITSKTVQLVSIDVTMVLGRGRFLFDGTVPGMDQAEFRCEFVLKNRSDSEEEIKVGFPVDSEFARPNDGDSGADSQNWVFEYAFIARDEKATYHVDFVKRKPGSGPGEFGSIFVWNMHFNPRETKTLTVQYRIPMSMGLVASSKDDERSPLSAGALSQEMLDIAQLEMTGYITSTGSSWAGNVESAKFRLITRPFERYLAHRGITEELTAEMEPEEASRFEASFPVHHPWWFREIKPDGWKRTEEGVEWQYKDFKPADAISIRYYMTQFPRVADEVDPFIDSFLKGLRQNLSAPIELNRLKQVVLATYGKEPEDDSVKAFTSKQLWYAPRKDFFLSALDEREKAVLKRIDARITAAKGAR